ALNRFGKLGQATPIPTGEMSFLNLQRIFDEAAAWGRRYYSKGGFLRAIDDPAILAITESMAGTPPASAEAYCLQLAGAVCDVDESATAYSGREAGHYWIAQCMWDDPAEDQAAIAWSRRAAAQLAAVSLATNYVNEQADTGIARSAYGEAKYN